MSVWEPEILNLDYAPILLRYKTEYTNFFKVFKRKYKQDRKQILALSKTVLKKLPDDAVVDLLTNLKYYHDKLNWLEQNASELERLLGNYYKGLDSDWGYITNAVDICSQMRNLHINETSPLLLDIVSVEHSEEAAKLDVLLTELTTALTTVKNEVASLEAEIDIDLENFDVEETKHISLTISDNAMETLTAQALNNLQNGGRGIGNVVENLLINPLSRYLFDNEIFDNASVTIDKIDTAVTPPSLECTKG